MLSKSQRFFPPKLLKQPLSLSLSSSSRLRLKYHHFHPSIINVPVSTTGSHQFTTYSHLQSPDSPSQYFHNPDTPPPPSPPPPPPAPPLRGFAKLSNRSLFAVGGPDASKFLNGIVTNKIISPEDPEFDDTEAIYAAFLNSKGRIVADSFIYPIHSNDHIQSLVSPLLPAISSHGQKISDIEVEYLVDCDSEVAKQLFMNLKLYKLRSLVSVAQIPSDLLTQWMVWDDTSVSETFPLEDAKNLNLYNPDTLSQGVAFTDVRSPAFGLRLVLPSGIIPSDFLSSGFVSAEPGLEEASLASYNIRRILFGIPEGAKELTPARSLPLESCIDFMGGVNFNKGCYVGQELTIRSHHHGVVRKRIIPIVFYSPSENLAQASADSPENSEEEVDLAYDPSSPISSVIDTSTCLIGGNIIDIKPRVDEGSRKGPSPFGDRTGSSPFGPRKKKQTTTATTDENQETTDKDSLNTATTTTTTAGVKEERQMVSSSSRPIGNIIASVGNIGLALVRLEQFAAPDAKLAVSIMNPITHTHHYVRVRGFQPFWWPQPEE